MKGFESVSLCLSWEIHLRAVSASVHTEGVDPNSMEGVSDLDHIDDFFV